MSTQTKYTQPTFTINEQPGWHTRLLYSYYGFEALDYYAQTGGYTQNLFEVIDTYWGGVNPPYMARKGTYFFPNGSRFFKTGKHIRIEGRLRVSSTNSAIFNIDAGIYNENSGLITLAASNKRNDHSFALANGRDSVPVYFKINYMSWEDDSSNLYMAAEGHYQYEFESYNGGGPNTTVTYVPIWIDKGPYVKIDNIQYSNKLYISFDGSSGITNITPICITVEELQ